VKKYSGLDYRPPQKGESYDQIEFAFFDENHLLPRVIVHVQSIPSIGAAPTTKPDASWSVHQVANWLMTLDLQGNYAQNIIDQGIDGKVLLTMTSEQDWKEIGMDKFGDQRKCVAALK